MAELSTIARPYAEALYAAAAGQAAPWEAPLERLAAVARQPDVAAALANPHLSETQRVELLVALSGLTLPAPVLELVKLIVENRRLPALDEVALQFRALNNAARGVADCLIESAFPLAGAELDALVQALARKFPFQLKPEVKVNPQLIGGVRVTVGDRVLDNSVRARLDAMQARLTA